MKWKDYIESNPEVLFGKPVLKGTRISVELILEKLGEGTSEDQLLKSYPNLSSKQIQACLLFAAQSLRGEVTFPVAS